MTTGDSTPGRRSDLANRPRLNCQDLESRFDSSARSSGRCGKSGGVNSIDLSTPPHLLHEGQALPCYARAGAIYDAAYRFCSDACRHKALRHQAHITVAKRKLESHMTHTLSRILVPTDFSAASDGAVWRLAARAARHRGTGDRRNLGG
jgi:hypothetical protein